LHLTKLVLEPKPGPVNQLLNRHFMPFELHFSVR